MKKRVALSFFLLLFSVHVRAMEQQKEQLPYMCVDAAYNADTLRILAQVVKDARDISPLSREQPELYLLEYVEDESPHKIIPSKVPYTGNMRCLNGQNCIINSSPNRNEGGVWIGDAEGTESFPYASNVVAYGDDLLLVGNDSSLHNYSMSDVKKMNLRTTMLKQLERKRPSYEIIDASHVGATGLLPMRFCLGGEGWAKKQVALFDVQTHKPVQMLNFNNSHKVLMFQAHQDSTRYFTRPCDQMVVVTFQGESKIGMESAAAVHDPRSKGEVQKRVSISCTSMGQQEARGRIVRDPDWLVPSKNSEVLVSIHENFRGDHEAVISQFDLRKESVPVSIVTLKGFYQAGSISDDGKKVAIVLKDYKSQVSEYNVYEIAYGEDGTPTDRLVHALAVAQGNFYEPLSDSDSEHDNNEEFSADFPALATLRSWLPW